MVIHDKRSEEPGVVIKNWRSDEELAEWRFTIRVRVRISKLGSCSNRDG